jgi:hypothetical protein
MPTEIAIFIRFLYRRKGLGITRGKQAEIFFKGAKMLDVISIPPGYDSQQLRQDGSPRIVGFAGDWPCSIRAQIYGRRRRTVYA